MRWIVVVLTCVATLMMTSTTRADSITLKSSVRLPDGAGAITLGSIAVLEGQHAEKYADLVIAPLSEQARAVELNVDLIRSALNEAGVHWGHVNLNGRHVVVRPSIQQVRGETLLAMKGIDLEGNAINASTMSVKIEKVTHDEVDAEKQRLEKASRVGATAATLSTEQTVRGQLARHCIQAFRLSAQDLRLEFDDEVRDWISAERPFLTIDVQPRGQWTEDRVVVEVRLWNGTDLLEKRILNVWPRIRVTMLTATRDVSRNTMLSSADFTSEARWVTASEGSRLAQPNNVAGMIATDRLREGQVLFNKHLRGDTVVRRGDVLNIRCLVGGMTVAVSAEAREDGAIGDEIAVRMSGEREEFRVEIVSATEAVFHVRNRH